jgi:uncharacterized membrane protein YdjX (TVP38/TMEM64 family)
LGVAVVVLAYVVAYTTGVIDHFSRDDLRRTLEGTGAIGVVAFFLLFAVGALLQVPPTLFIGAAVLAYGPHWGGAISFFAACTAILVSFVLVRTVGGQVLVEIEQPWVRRTLKRLDERPFITVFVLRSVLWVSPPLNYALAMSGVRFRDFALASCLGMIGPMLFIVAFFGWLFE